MSEERHLTESSLVLLAKGEDLPEVTKEGVKQHLPGCDECCDRFVQILRLEGGAVGISLLGLSIAGVEWRRAVYSLSLDPEIREIVAECLRRYESR